MISGSICGVPAKNSIEVTKQDFEEFANDLDQSGYSSIYNPINNFLKFIEDILTPAAKPFKIGITGRVGMDGIGDLVHMLNIGNALTRKGVTEVVYQIDFSFNYSGKSLSRLNLFVSKLKSYNLLDKSFEIKSNDSLKEIIADLNRANPKNLFILDHSIENKEHAMQLADRFTKLGADFWISVSQDFPVFGDPFEYPFPEYPLSKHIGLYELEAAEKTINPNFLHRYYNFTNYKMGIPDTSGNIGVLLEDKVDRSRDTRSVSLHNILNKKFNDLLKAGLSPSEQTTTKLIKTTEFILAYPQHINKAIASDLIVHVCTKSSLTKSQVFVKLGGWYDFERLTSKENQDKLRDAGFKEVQFINSKTGNLESINLLASGNQKVLKLLTDCYLDENESAEFMSISGPLTICSGDNTLQDALSHGAIPILIPRHDGKEKVLAVLSKYLEMTGLDSKFPHSMKFLEVYNNLAAMNAYNEEKAPYIMKAVEFINEEMIEEWREICKYIIENFNLRSILVSYIDKLEEHLNSSQVKDKFSARDLLVKILDQQYLLVPEKWQIEDYALLRLASRSNDEVIAELIKKGGKITDTGLSSILAFKDKEAAELLLKETSKLGKKLTSAAYKLQPDFMLEMIDKYNIQLSDDLKKFAYEENDIGLLKILDERNLNEEELIIEVIIDNLLQWQ